MVGAREVGAATGEVPLVGETLAEAMEVAGIVGLTVVEITRLERGRVAEAEATETVAAGQVVDVEHEAIRRV